MVNDINKTGNQQKKTKSKTIEKIYAIQAGPFK